MQCVGEEGEYLLLGYEDGIQRCLKELSKGAAGLPARPTIRFSSRENVLVTVARTNNTGSYLHFKVWLKGNA